MADLQHGRQGGRWFPKGYVPADVATAKLCAVCGQPMLVDDSDRHRTCQAGELLELFPDA